MTLVSAPNPYEFIDGSNPDATSSFFPGGDYVRKGQFEYWTGTIREAIQESLDGALGSPFTDVKIGGSKDYATDNRIELIDHDMPSTTSGYLSVTMASGWQGLFYIKTKDYDFFEDNAIDATQKGDWLSDDVTWQNNIDMATTSLTNEWPSIWVQDNAEWSHSRTVFGLSPGDYMSFDIDNETDTVGQARVRIDGVQYLNNAGTDDDIGITAIWLRYWNPNATAPGNSSYDDPDPNPPFSCPPGQIDNGFGICVLDGDYEPVICPLGQIDDGFGTCIPDPNYEGEPENDVTGFGMVMVLIAIGLIVSIALKVRA